jgi:type IV fimbrial biogenesis protein FimT
VVIAMRQRGFTLMEALVVLVIVGILAVVAFPSMTTFFTKQSIRATAYDLFADLIYARSEAINRGTTVSIVGASGTNWKQGWTIRENAGGTTLRSQPARDSAIVFTSSQDTVTFDRSGRADAAVTFTIVPEAATTQDDQKRCIRIDPSGRPKSSEGACA